MIWLTCDETKSLKPKRLMRPKAERGSRSTSIFSKKRIPPYKKKGDERLSHSSGMSSRICIKRVERYEGHVSIKNDRKKTEEGEDAPSPGTSGVITTVPVPTEARPPGTCDTAETTPVPTEKILPGTGGAARTAPVPTGEPKGRKEEDRKNTPLFQHLLSQKQREVDNIEDPVIEEKDDDRTVIVSIGSEEEEEVPVKRGRGRPPTTGEFVGIREKRKAEKEARKERELESRIQEALTPDMPRNKKQWEKFLEREADLDSEFIHAPTLDLEARIMKSTVKIFKLASCSTNMSGNLVGGIREAVAITKAAMTVLAGRVKEREEASSFVKREKELVKKIEQLKKKGWKEKAGKTSQQSTDDSDTIPFEKGV